jgi:NAD(P) transhydrogenase subunit alpha
MDLFARQAREVDIIITTALVPGKPAPKLITEAMVETMQDGGVVVDLAAEQGGNCTLTKPGKVIEKHGVTIIGYTDMPSRMSAQASQLYASNLYHLLTDMCPEKNGELVVNMEDEVIRGTTVIKDGEITWPPPAPKISAAPPAPVEKPKAEPEEKKAPLITPTIKAALTVLVGGLLFYGMGISAPPSFLQHFTVFVLACFVGYMVIWNVTPALHTPLMSVTNAISSIIIIGALIQVSSPNTLLAGVAAFGVFITSINIFGGFAVTQRMLQMFRK